MGDQRHAPAALSPGKPRYLLYRNLGGPQNRSVQVRKISPSIGIRSPDPPARNESLYRLRYPGSSTTSGPLHHSVSSVNTVFVRLGCPWTGSQPLTSDIFGISQFITNIFRTQSLTFHHEAKMNGARYASQDTLHKIPFTRYPSRTVSCYTPQDNTTTVVYKAFSTVTGDLGPMNLTYSERNTLEPPPQSVIQHFVEIKCQLDATEVFIAGLIACSTCFGHHYAHYQELKSIIQWLQPVVFRAVVFKLLVWCGAEQGRI